MKNTTTKGARKKEIMKQATSLFQRRGYAASSVRDLALESGIEAPSLYSHFRSKEEILQQICFQMAHAFMNGLILAEARESNQERLKGTIKEHIRVIIKNPEAAAVMWNEWHHLSEPYLEDFKKMKREYEERFRKIVKKGMKQDEFKQMDATLVSNLLLSTLNGITGWYKPEMRGKEIYQSIVRIVFKGILK